MTQNGRPASTSLAPAPKGNRRAARHLAYATFTPADLEEVRALEDEIRGLCPIDSPSIEPAVSALAFLLWRRAKLYAYIDDVGVTRGRPDRATINPAFEALDRLERQVIETMRQLAMLPRQAAPSERNLTACLPSPPPTTERCPMHEEQFQKAAEELPQGAVEDGATPSEQLRLRAGPDAIVIRLGYELEPGRSELLVDTTGQPVDEGERVERAETPELTTIYRRITLRNQLGLPNRDCRARRQREGCRCLSQAIDALLDVQSVNKQWVRSVAKERHTVFVAGQKRVERDAKKPEKRAREAQDPKRSPAAATLDRADATPPAPPKKREPPHPLSIEADVAQGLICGDFVRLSVYTTAALPRFSEVAED